MAIYGPRTVEIGDIIMKYRKKPVVIEAIEFEYSIEGIQRLKEFCGSALGNTHKERHPSAKGEAEIGTLEDGIKLTVKHIATEGDFIIKGVQGEFYPCKPDIFHATYEPVEEFKRPMYLRDIIQRISDQE